MIHNISDKAIAVEVPEDSYSPLIHNNELWQVPKSGLSVRKKFTKLPPGNWQILGRASEIAEQQWAAVLDFDYGLEPLTTAQLEGLSLLKSKSLSPNCLILINKV